MHVSHNPSTVAPPFGTYSHGIEVPAGARWLYASGQVGVMPDGTVADGIEAQSEWALRNLMAVLDAAGMEPRDLVRLNQYLTRAEDVGAFRAVRARFLGELRPASTLVMVGALASPDWLVEVEAVAAKA